MTRRVGPVLLLESEQPQQCDLCGQVRELRPYGPGGACVCFGCAMKDEPEAKRQFRALLDTARRYVEGRDP